jgi:hypothetical protein
MIRLGKLKAAVVSLMLLAAVSGCRTTYYKAWEAFGRQKRDLLKSNVQDARDDQKKATEQFKDALTRLREMYGVGAGGGDLEKMYDRLKSDYERCEARAGDVKSRIRKVEQISSDLFKEWQQEIGTMTNEKLASGSRQKLRDTEEKYDSLHAAMIKAEGSMEPVLKQFHDQVLYLKHNLNAQAIGSLKGESSDIEREIQRLIEDMNASITEADAFIHQMK